jgi:PAS domain S-box-containing protein
MERTIHGQGKVSFDEAGKPIRMTGTVQDITERRQAEDQLSEQRKSMRVILENAPVGIWRLGVDKRIKFINSTFCNAIGVEERRFLEAEHYAKLLPEDVGRNCMASDEACFDTGARVRSIEEILCVDGKLHTFEIIKAPIFDDQRSMQGLVGLATDITNRKQTEEKIKENLDKMQKFHRLAVGRELKMIELKNEINELLADLGREDKYDIPDAGSEQEEMA